MSLPTTAFSIFSARLTLRTLIFVLCLIAVSAWGIRDVARAQPLPDPPPVPPSTVAVAPLANLTGDGGLDWIGVGLQDRLSREVQRFSTARVLDLQELVQQARELPATLAGIGPDRLIALAGQLGANGVVAGDYRGTGQQITITLTLLDVSAKRVLASQSTAGSPAQIDAQARRTLGEMTRSLSTLFPPRATPVGAGAASVPPGALAAQAQGITATAESLLGGGVEALRRAVAQFRQAAQAAPSDGETWYRLGECQVRLGEFEEARQSLARGLDLARAAGDGSLELAALAMVGESYLLQGRAALAEPTFDEILRLARQAGDWPGQIAAVYGLASALHLRGEPERAREVLGRALALARATGNRRAEARLLNHLGVLHVSLGEYGPARQYLGQAVSLAQAIGERTTERMGLNNLSVIAIRQGAYREAREALDKVLGITRALGDRRGEALAKKNIGQVEAFRGAYAAALPILEEALALTRTVVAPLNEVEVLQILGMVHVAQEAYPEAQAAYERGLGLARTHKVPGFEALMLHNLGQVAVRRMALDEAKRYEEAALAITQKVTTPRVQVLALHGLGEVELLRGDYAASRALFGQAAAVATRLGHTETLWQIHYGLGRVHEAQGDAQAALAEYRQAVTIVTGLTGQFGAEEERLVFLSHRMAVYDALTRLLLRLHEQESSRGYDREAWAILEAKRGRMAGEALTAVRPTLRDGRAQAESEQARATLDQALAVERALRTEQSKGPETQRSERVQSLTAQLAQTKAEYRTQVQAFLARYPRYKTQFVDQKSVDPEVLAKYANRLPAGTLAVQYFAAPDALYLFVVAPGGRFQVKRQAVAQAELYELVRRYRKFIERGAARPLSWKDDGSDKYRRDILPLKEIGQQLAAHLLAPIQAELAAHPHLILIPNDLLLYLPIHALPRPQPDGSSRFLAETHRVSYVTQLELADLLLPAAPAADPPLLALANPDGSLPAASREVRELRRIRAEVRTLDGAAATKEQFLALAATFPDLHLATHGILDPQRPERSYLLMAGADESSQRLGIDEIAGLSLPGGLAVLSACETALGEQVPGAALITLAAAFSQAGSQSILASLWKVHDAATRDFMIAFYGSLSKTGRAGALQQAQRTLIQRDATAHPFYWAPFILIGGR